MKDKNGNYFCSDISKVCTPTQRLCLLNEIESDIVDLSTHQFGTHPIQTLIELSKTKEEINQLIRILSIKDTLITLARDANGLYVIQKLITTIPEQKRLLFNKILLENFVDLSLDMYGVCNIKIYLMQSHVTLSLAMPIVLSYFLLISQNQYGNYLIQYLIEMFWNRTEVMPLKHLIGNNYFVALSENRFASHITEKYVNMLNSIEKKMLLYTLICTGCSGILFKDKFGMYVMNKLANNH